MSSEAGEDLDWFWRGWFFNNWQLDLAVTSIAYTDGDPAKGSNVTLESRDKLVMPAVLEVKYADGHATRIKLPVETWMRIRPVIAVPAGRIASVMLDPDHLLPDRDRGNNDMAP